MKRIALIPARGGSKGISYKNMSELYKGKRFGTNLLDNTIQRLEKSLLIDEIWVSTDDKFIKNFIEDFYPKVNIHERSKETSSDFASTESVMEEFVDFKGMDSEDIIVLIQCTSPFLNVKKLDESIEKIQQLEFLSALSVTKTHRFFWMKQSKVGTGISLNYDPESRKRRQDLDKEPFFVENGAFYLTSIGAFKDLGFRIPPPVYLSVQEEEYTQWEIDTSLDLEVVRTIYKEVENNE